MYLLTQEKKFFGFYHMSRMTTQHKNTNKFITLVPNEILKNLKRFCVGLVKSYPTVYKVHDLTVELGRASAGPQVRGAGPALLFSFKIFLIMQP